MLYAVLLRRVNVGGSHVRMADLLETFGAAGYPEAVSVLASGNIVVRSNAPLETHSILDSISARHGFITELYVRSRDDLIGVIERCPFEREGGKIEIVFMHEPLTRSQEDTLSEIAVGPDLLTPIGREIHWYRPLPLGESIPKERHLRQVIGGDSTRRTMGTVERIVHAMEQFT